MIKIFVKAVMIKAIIGLGNPGPKFYNHRHNIGFRVLDALAKKYDASWQKKNNMELAEINVDDKNILLIKPQTFMNSSGQVIPFLQKKGIKPENILVVHDELEKPFGKLIIKQGGSARGHNGLRSLIAVCGPEFYRLRFGIGRPAEKAEVPDYVLSNFDQEATEVETHIEQVVQMIQEFLQ